MSNGRELLNYTLTMQLNYSGKRENESYTEGISGEIEPVFQRFDGIFNKTFKKPKMLPEKGHIVVVPNTGENFEHREEILSKIRESFDGSNFVGNEVKLSGGSIVFYFERAKSKPDVHEYPWTV